MTNYNAWLEFSKILKPEQIIAMEIENVLKNMEFWTFRVKGHKIERNENALTRITNLLNSPSLNKHYKSQLSDYKAKAIELRKIYPYF